MVSRTFLGPVLEGEESLATLPQFEPVRSASGLSTPHPSRNPKGFRNAFLTRLRRRNCAPPPSQHRFARVMPMAILLRRSFIRYRPSASRSGRGVAEESLTRLRTASRTHEPRQQELARLVLPPPAQSLAAIAQLPGIIGEASRWLLCDGPPRCRSPRLIRRRAWKVEEKVLFPAPILPACGCTTQAPKW